MSRKELVVDVDKCTGCRSCVTACSFVKTGSFKLVNSRINIIMKEDKMLNIPTMCWQCEKPPCGDVCPVNAIVKDRKTGMVNILSDLCIGCKACTSACPFGAVTMDYEKGIAVKCDLCNGEPECVKVCTPNALQYVEAGRPMVLRRSEYGEKYLKALETAFGREGVAR